MGNSRPTLKIAGYEGGEKMEGQKEKPAIAVADLESVIIQKYYNVILRELKKMEHNEPINHEALQAITDCIRIVYHAKQFRRTSLT